MRKPVYNTIISILILVMIAAVFGVLSTEISLKYETDYSKECLSNITGEDLCLRVKILKIIIVACLILTSGLISFRYKLTKS